MVSGILLRLVLNKDTQSDEMARCDLQVPLSFYDPFVWVADRVGKIHLSPPQTHLTMHDDNENTIRDLPMHPGHEPLVRSVAPSQSLLLARLCEHVHLSRVKSLTPDYLEVVQCIPVRS